MDVDSAGLGRIRQVDSRGVWQSEATDFTPWLADNLDVLAEALGLTLALVGTEVPVGGYRLDIQAETPDGGTVVIENQLDRTDHGHLGQLLAYGSGLDARAIVWVAPQVREDHRSTLDWLNEHTTTGLDFFAVEVRIVQIGEGGPRAPLFDVVVRPNAWQKQVTAAVGAGGLNEARQGFFTDVMTEFARTRPIRVPARQNQNWIEFASGPWGYWGLAAAASRLRIEAYIDSGDKAANKALYDELATRRDALEQRVGFPLSWERLDDKRASRIAAYRDVESYDGEDRPELRDWAVQALTAMYDALNETLRKRGRELRNARRVIE